MIKGRPALLPAARGSQPIITPRGAGRVDAFTRTPLYYATPTRTGPPSRIVLSEWSTDNPFHYVPQHLLQEIKAYYAEGFSKIMCFEEYLWRLHEDGLTPEEVLDVIGGRRGGRAAPSA